MEIVIQIIAGLIMITVGVLTLKDNYRTANTLPIGFAEAKLGPGSSYSVWKLLSILLILAGITTIFGFWRPLMEWILSPLTNLLNSGK